MNGDVKTLTLEEPSIESYDGSDLTTATAFTFCCQSNP